MKKLILILLCSTLATLSCGEIPSESPEPDSEPPSGPRYFEGNDREFFGPDSPIITIRPELGYRPDLKLHDDVYWVPDEVAERREVIDESTVRVKLTGEADDIALRYEVGMVVLHKFYPLRHRILGVEVRDDYVVWNVVVADYDEVIEQGDVYVKMPPGTPTPVGFDVLDPWLYESREAQLRVIRDNYLDSELIGMMATEESIEEAKRIRDREASKSITTRQAQSDNPFPPPRFCQGMTEAELGCDEVYERGTPEYQGCLDRKDPCDGLYGNDEEGQAALAECEAAAAAGEFSLPSLMVCDAYVRNNIDTMQARGNSGAQPLSWEHDHCIDAGHELNDCSFGFFANNGGCVAVGEQTYRANRDEDGQKIPFNICPVFRPGLNLDESVKLVCEELCRFDEDRRDADGGASADDWGAGVGVCINSDVFPGGDKCRARTAAKVSPGGVELTAAIDFGDGFTGELPVKLTLTPVFTSAVGFTADMKISAFWAGVKIGFFAGIGIGNQTTLEFTENGARIEKTVDILQKLGIQEQLEVPLPPILFLTFFVRPVLEVEFFAEASVQGKAVHDYFQEKSFAICMAAKIGAGPGYDDWPKGFWSGQEAVDKCDMPITLESENINDLRLEETPSGVEVRAGLELLLGIELVLKISGAVEVGSITYYPFVARFALGATFRPPRCSLNITIAFGWRLRAQIEVGISRFKINLVDEHLGGTYPAPRYYETFPLDIPGCGEVEPPEPAEYEGLTCPPGPDPQDPDGNCASLPEFTGTSASCFVDRCVEQEAIRASMAWFDPEQDLDLYLRDPNGVTYSRDDLLVQSCGSTCGGTCSDDTECLSGWICDVGKCTPEDPTFIESFTAPAATPGEWQAWVVRREGTSEQPVLFDLEFETRGQDGKRQTTRGSIDPEEDGSAYEFVFCVGEECP